MCDLVDRQLLGELIAAKTTSCQYCGARIDLTTDEWKARIAEALRQHSDPSR